MDTYKTIVQFFQDGGFFMYPIMLVLAVGLAIAVERWIYLSLARGRNRKVWKQVEPLIRAGNLRQARELVGNSRTALARILSYGLDRVSTARRREDVEMAMEEGLMEIIPRLERRTPYLATFANLATLLGLLGTIIGLIDAFTAVAEANPAEKAALLSGSISVAMNTTAFGLMAGIPLLLLHAWLQSRTTEVVDSLEMATVRLLNALGSRSDQVVQQAAA